MNKNILDILDNRINKYYEIYKKYPVNIITNEDTKNLIYLELKKAYGDDAAREGLIPNQYKGILILIDNQENYFRLNEEKS